MTFITTATAHDSEMAARTVCHQGDRPEHWSLIEEPVDLLGAVADVGSEHPVIVDCLALWLNNRLFDEPDQIPDKTHAPPSFRGFILEAL